jgi:hypothetical protein
MFVNIEKLLKGKNVTEVIEAPEYTVLLHGDITPEVRAKLRTSIFLAPGSAEALSNGCECLMVENNYGKGKVQNHWTIHRLCPIHSCT